nr:MAG TPA: hypothetical protein [Caudoviricetes sp.]
MVYTLSYLYLSLERFTLGNAIKSFPCSDFMKTSP